MFPNENIVPKLPVTSWHKDLWITKIYHKVMRTESHCEDVPEIHLSDNLSFHGQWSESLRQQNMIHSPVLQSGSCRNRRRDNCVKEVAEKCKKINVKIGKRRIFPDIDSKWQQNSLKRKVSLEKLDVGDDALQFVLLGY